MSRKDEIKSAWPIMHRMILRLMSADHLEWHWHKE